MGVMAEVMGVRMESKKRCSFERSIRSYGRWMGGAATYHLIKATYLEAATIIYSALLASTRSPLYQSTEAFHLAHLPLHWVQFNLLRAFQTPIHTMLGATR